VIAVPDVVTSEVDMPKTDTPPAAKRRRYIGDAPGGLMLTPAPGSDADAVVLMHGDVIPDGFTVDHLILDDHLFDGS
jgi:hypothetical protein